MVGMAEVVAPISLDGVAVHSDYLCICLCYLHFAPENPEDGKMYLLVPAHPGYLGQSPYSHKMVVLCVCHLCAFIFWSCIYTQHIHIKWNITCILQTTTLLKSAVNNEQIGFGHFLLKWHNRNAFNVVTFEALTEVFHYVCIPENNIHIQ